MGHFAGNSKSVGLAGAAPAPSLLATLQPGGDDAQLQVERERQWKLNERKKYVSFAVPPKWDKDSLMAAFRASGKVFAHKGSLNSSHRLICASADLFHECEKEPWSQQSKPCVSTWKDICEFCCSLSGSEDFIMLFDGRMRDVRRVHEDNVLSFSFAEEATIMYQGGCLPRAGRTRKVPLSAKKVETVAMRFPVARSKIRASKKEAFTACGEASTFQGTYSAVE